MVPEHASRVATFHPAWGAVAMTASGVALVSLLDPWAGSGADDLTGAVTLGFALVVAIATSVFFIARLVSHREAFHDDLADPQLGAMTAAWPASLLIAALAVLQAGVVGVLDGTTALWTALVLFIPGLVGTFVVGVAFYTRVIGSTDVPLPAVSGNWFVPVVPLVLVPSILVRTEALGGPVDSASLAFAAVATWGIGFGLFLLLAAIVGGRLLIASPPPPHAAPTWWVWLAPIGAGALGIISISRLSIVGEAWPDATDAAFLLAAMLWGFGLWWAVFAGIVIFRQRRQLRFRLPVWGFGFPTAAWIALTVELARHWGLPWLVVAGTALWVMLLVGFAALVIVTVVQLRSGAIFRR
ncbi:SLAC1 family transporter [Agromyces sp. ZXT2-6]|uniref:SLAC1 family transporter n=1 Tax=Agromyces sp. ZXT2-6 TaxID=3461153 RepID=UPI0040551486